MKKSLLLLLFIILIACEQRTELITDAERLAITDSIKQAMNNYAVAVKSLDAKQITDLYLDSQDFAVAGNDDYYPSRDSLYKTFQEHLKMCKSIDSFEWIDPKIFVLCKDAASSTSKFHYMIFLKSGNSLDVKGYFTFVFTRTSGHWKIAQLNVSAPCGK